MHGYQLRQEFDARTGSTWPLNIGQAYTTLSRLERNGLVHKLPSKDPDDPERFELTDAGRQAAAEWWREPVPRSAPARDELAIKLAIAVTIPGVDVASVLQSQRAETMKTLQCYTRLKARSAPPEELDGAELAWGLVLDSLIFAAEAEARWLDHVEGTLVRVAQNAHHRTHSEIEPTPTPIEPVEIRGARR